ncbi:probable disease resistance protein At1g58602 isoform X2 [Amaranthus tricolor]|uniref:probable disease resistance protein At1g58602 isoform X2 n=1 Tax=Amaranthus tricolor TaxID=29722 RepID=UPI002584F6C0|nr:probable disease resistance protein At1g58602 isoform X2 [Amaranthus tricolor]
MPSSLVASTIQWIGSLLIQEGRMLFEVEDQVRSLQAELELMQEYLQDADAMQERKEIYTLIKQIRKLAFDAEDIIDTYILEVEAKANFLGNMGWFVKFVSTLHTAPRAYSLGKQIELIQSNVKRITDRLVDNGVRRINNVFDMRSLSDPERCSRLKPRSYSYDDDGENVVGLEKDVKRLVEVLMGEENTQVNLVSIVGMGGSGKTTLARKLYNHPYTKECFDCCSWVYISQEWSARRVLYEILRKVSFPMEISKLNADSSLDELVEKLRIILEKKSYFVVLDDVWRKEALEEVLPAFPLLNNNKGSKILITTRNKDVVQFQNLQRHLYVHEPQPLSMEESRELFCKIVFNCQTNFDNESYEGLVKEMLMKCNGLPLAIVALAGILNTKRSIQEWQQVNEAVRSRVMESNCTHLYGRVGDVLALSYNDLPCDLKPCFLYLGVFPEDCQIPAGMLTRMWIAEGLVTENEYMSTEDVAMQHLEELSKRFLIRVVRTNFKGAIKTIHIHDLLHELCIKKAREQWFFRISTPNVNFAANDASAINIPSRRVALHSSTHFPAQAPNLRSLVILTRSTIIHSAYVSKEELDFGNLHHNFKLLRLLNLWGIKTPTGALPSQIGCLIHLRYLGIRASNITELPKSIGNLKYLLTLDYRNVESNKNVEIPDILYKLKLLRHLYLPIECPWSLKDLKLHTLQNLQVLWGIKCEKGKWFAREMKKLSTTLKKLKVVVSTEIGLDSALSCPSLMSDTLQSFSCKWNSGVVLRVNRSFSHNQHLHKLVLVGRIEVEKLSNILPSNLLDLELKDSALEDEDPIVVAGGLAHLKRLRLSNSYKGTTSICNIGSFLQLEELYLDNLENLREWTIEKGSMLGLKKLEIGKCRKLENFPLGLRFVTTLQQLEFHEMPVNFGQEAATYGWSQARYRLPHNLNIIIEQCDTLLDMSSIHKIYEQLSTGIFINDKQKRFWVVKKADGEYCNCFMLCVKALILSTRLDIDGLPVSITDWNDWEWTQTNKRDGSLTEVAKLKSPVIVLNVGGTFNTEDLSPKLAYTIS